jgi:hypothetical protein
MKIHVYALLPASTRTRMIVPISTDAKMTPEENLKDFCTSVLPDMHSGKFLDGVRKSPSSLLVAMECADQPQEGPRQREETSVPGK